MPLNTKIPTLITIKENKPKVAVSNEIFNPAANNSGFGFPIASIVSKAEIKPKIEAKKPITRPNKLLSAAILRILTDCAIFVLVVKNPLTKKSAERSKQIKIKDIITVPPSVNTFDKKIDKDIIINGFS